MFVAIYDAVRVAGAEVNSARPDAPVFVQQVKTPRRGSVALRLFASSGLHRIAEFISPGESTGTQLSTGRR